MAGFNDEGIKDEPHPEKETGIEELLISIEEAMAGFENLLPEGSGDEEDYDDEEPDAEEEEYDGFSLSEKVRKYQREFRKYVEIIRKDLGDMGYDIREGRTDVKGAEYAGKKDQERQRDSDSEISPWERGHKWGCGCPGCTSFRENFISKEIMDFSIPDGRSSYLMAKETNADKSEHKDDSSQYPCGGKLRGVFKRGFLKYALADVAKKPGMMNYLAV